ncbi:MAG: 2-oxo acid dehydrogenase subunit E2 [bacterium]|nr:2-oxo acid dehydrogenase subunit E2 [bacterium]
MAAQKIASMSGFASRLVSHVTRRMPVGSLMPGAIPRLAVTHGFGTRPSPVNGTENVAMLNPPVVLATSTNLRHSHSSAGHGHEKWTATVEATVPWEKLNDPVTMFRELPAAIQKVFRTIRTISDIQRDPRIAGILTDQERENMLHSAMIALASGETVSQDFLRATLGLPLTGAAAYMPLTAGLSREIESIWREQLAWETAQTPVHYSLQYRVPPLVDEMVNAGMSIDDIKRVFAAAPFAHITSAEKLDWTMTQYPPKGADVIGVPGSGSRLVVTRPDNFLGMGTKRAAANVLARAILGLPQPCEFVWVGDSGPETAGFHDGMKMLKEVALMGKEAHGIVVVMANGRKITSQVEGGEPEKVAKSHFRRLKLEGALDLPDTLEEMRADASDVYQVNRVIVEAAKRTAATGKWTSVIISTDDRVWGHASDKPNFTPEQIQQKFNFWVQFFVNQMSSVAPDHLQGPDIADMMAEHVAFSKSVKAEQLAQTGKFLDRDGVVHASVPGMQAQTQDPGTVHHYPLAYWTSPPEAGSPLGADVFGAAMNETLGDLNTQGIPYFVVSQENLTPQVSGSRRQVYGQFEGVDPSLLEGKFWHGPVDERTQATVQAALVSQLTQYEPTYNPKTGLRDVERPAFVIDVEPHSKFTDLSHMERASFMGYSAKETGERTAGLTLIDGGSLSRRVDGNEEARVGEHHNCPEMRHFLGNPNGIVLTPADMNDYKALLPEIKRLILEEGRHVVVWLPTKSHSAPHRAVDPGHFTLNSHKEIEIPGKSDGTSREVISWGPDMDRLIGALHDEEYGCTVRQVFSNKLPNSLLNSLLAKANSGEKMEIVLVDPSPEMGYLGGIHGELANALSNYPNVTMRTCSETPAFVPYGVGSGLLHAWHYIKGIVRGESFDARTERAPQVVPLKGLESAGPAAKAGEVMGVQVITSDKEQKDATFSGWADGIEPGCRVKKHQVLFEVETDKASIQVLAPCDGTLELNGQYENGDAITLNKDVVVRITATESTPADADSDEPVDPSSVVVRTKTADTRPLIPMEAAMVDSMTVKVGDPKQFSVKQRVNFQLIIDAAKRLGVTPNTLVMMLLSDAMAETGSHYKLSEDGTRMASPHEPEIGYAADIDGKLYTLSAGCLRAKLPGQINRAVHEKVALGRFSLEDIDMTHVTAVVSSLGKLAPEEVDPVLVPGVPLILGVGGMDPETGKAKMTFAASHREFTGADLAKVCHAFCQGVERLRETGGRRGHTPLIKFPDRQPQTPQEVVEELTAQQAAQKELAKASRRATASDLFGARLAAQQHSVRTATRRHNRTVTGGRRKDHSTWKE